MVTVTFGVCFCCCCFCFPCFSSSNEESDDKIFMAKASDFRMDTQWMIPRKLCWIQFDISSLYESVYAIIHKQWVFIGYNYIYNPLHMILITYSCISSLYPCDLIFTKTSLRTVKPASTCFLSSSAPGSECVSKQPEVTDFARLPGIFLRNLCGDFTRNTVIFSSMERARIELWHFFWNNFGILARIIDYIYTKSI